MERKGGGGGEWGCDWRCEMRDAKCEMRWYKSSLSPSVAIYCLQEYAMTMFFNHSITKDKRSKFASMSSAVGTFIQRTPDIHQHQYQIGEQFKRTSSRSRLGSVWGTEGALYPLFPAQQLHCPRDSILR